MEIKILCLYHDIMNLYGDTGNIKVLEYHLKELKIPYEISYKSLEDELNIKDYDLVMIGSGTEENRNICLKHLQNYKEEIKEAINEDKFFLVTGNALGMFGKTIYGETALEALDFDVEKSEVRNSKEVVYTNKICPPIYGFINNEDIVNSNEEYLFENEGIKKNHFYGTYVLGPILSRNPKFLKYFLKELITSKDIKIDIDKIDVSLNKEAYKEFIEFKKNKVFNAKHS